MATLYDLLNADATEVEEQRVIRAPGATTGDVLTVAANGTVSPAPGGGSQPFDSVTIAAPAEGTVFAATLATNVDSGIDMRMTTAGVTTVDINAGTGASGGAVLNMSDDDLDGSLALSTGGSSMTPRSTSGEGEAVLRVGTLASSFQINRDGVPVLRNHVVPADASLEAGECALWFDQTDGAAKLKVKAKSADGTVVTGSVNLA